MMKLIVAFRNFPNAPKETSILPLCLCSNFTEFAQFRGSSSAKLMKDIMLNNMERGKTLRCMGQFNSVLHNLIKVMLYGFVTWYGEHDDS
jgi:hypothetical protein